MSTIADIFARVRVELSGNYSDTTRWDDDNLLYMAKTAIDRVGSVVASNGLPIGRKRHTFSTVSGTYKYDVPSDFADPLYLVRTDTAKKVHFNTEDEWDRISSAGEELSEWAIIADPDDSDTQKIYVAATPTAAVAMVMPYYPFIDTSSYATTTTVPWGGRLDSVIADYLKVRCQNSDEMDTTQDQRLLAELEARVLSVLQGQQPRVLSRAGWNTGSTS